MANRKGPNKPAVVRVEMKGHIITCSCGEPWFAAVEAKSEGQPSRFTPLEEHHCPNCSQPPTARTTSMLEERVEMVPLTFRQLIGVGRVTPPAISPVRR